MVLDKTKKGGTADTVAGLRLQAILPTVIRFSISHERGP